MRTAASAAAPSATNVELELLVVILGFSGAGACNKPYATTVAAVTELYMGNAGFANFFTNCSYGTWGIDRSKFKVGALRSTVAASRITSWTGQCVIVYCPVAPTYCYIAYLRTLRASLFARCMTTS